MSEELSIALRKYIVLVSFGSEFMIEGNEGIGYSFIGVLRPTELSVVLLLIVFPFQNLDGGHACD